MSEEDDDQTLLNAFKDGALLVLKRPFTMDRLMLLRQHAIRKRIQNINNCDGRNKFSHVENYGILNLKNIGNHNVQNEFPWVMKKEPIIYGGEKTTCEMIRSERNSKIRLVWTPELHAKFMNAISQLGERKCAPKLIHELMGVPGITRAQISSHLQVSYLPIQEIISFTTWLLRFDLFHIVIILTLAENRSCYLIMKHRVIMRRVAKEEP
ncbi:hypothetical protein LXL04_020323 [Taraxacum kok-saghyz]